MTDRPRMDNPGTATSIPWKTPEAPPHPKGAPSASESGMGSNPERLAAGGIRFEGVTKRYPSRGRRGGEGILALDSLNLSIPAGRITVFVGPSGCGKSTTLRMINRMVEPSSGAITIDGVDVRERDAYELRRGIGYVMQSGGLMPHRTVAQNIATVPRLNGVPRKQARARALELLDLVGLDADYADRYPAQLSGGQVQRVGVARALAADAPILLMDEPFSAVDPLVRAELQRELLSLQARLGKTVVFVTHDIDEALLLGDRIAVFAEGGRLAQCGAPEEILYAPADEFVRSFVSRSVAGLLDERTVREARARRLEISRGDSLSWDSLSGDSRNSTAEGPDKE